MNDKKVARFLLVVFVAALAVVCPRQLRAETLPDRRPTLIGSGPGSLVNLIDVQTLFQKGQRDAWVVWAGGWLVICSGRRVACGKRRELRPTRPPLQGFSGILRGSRKPLNSTRSAKVSATLLFARCGARKSLRASCMKTSDGGMKTSKKMPIAACTLPQQITLSERVDDRLDSPVKESTYTLLARSEEKAGSLVEAAMYLALLIGPIIALLQFAEYRVIIPIGALL
jgi:hypothetical protein